MKAATVLPQHIHRRTLATVLSTTGQQMPNRLTQYYSRMKTEVCPDAIRAYSTCVTTTNEEGDLVKGSCQEEFAAVKECFRTVRRQAREQQA